jgi:hypothetical protein
MIIEAHNTKDISDDIDPVVCIEFSDDKVFIYNGHYTYDIPLTEFFASWVIRPKSGQ